MSLLKSDHWRSAILHTPMEHIARTNSLEGIKATLLPDDGAYRFLADPFGLWHEGTLYVFVEVYDYRIGRGVIDVLIYDESLRLLERHRVLEEVWHLSYPFVFCHENVFYMLPEGYKSGRLSLYRAISFPYRWQRVEAFEFPAAAIDATPFFHMGRWWLFWTPPEPRAYRQQALHIATAENLIGQWRDMGCFLVDRAGARPGGTPVVVDDALFLPVQDCRVSYGGALRFLKLQGLGEQRIHISPQPALEAPTCLRSRYPDGMHTLSGAGMVTLVDVKKIRTGISHKLFALKRSLLRT